MKYWRPILILASLLALSACRVRPTPTSAPAESPRGESKLVATESPSPRDYLVVSGRINLSRREGALDSLYIITSAIQPEAPTPGSYTIRLLGSDASTLADYAFTPVQPVDGDPNIALINAWVPWVQGTQRIAVISDTVVLAMRPVSAHPPQVTVTSPNGGESFSGVSTTVTWDGIDQDGDDLEYIVQYSPDDGTSWQVVGMRITGTTTYTVDLSLLPGSDTARIRVMATDGVNTAWDVSDGSFSVARKAPRARIDSPASGEAILPHQMVILRGSASDMEGGTLADGALSWTSDIDGVLGTGHDVDKAEWTPGLHTITLTATDANGLTATDTVTLTVMADSDDDTMPDTWENLYGLDPNTDDSMGDPDNDRLVNRDEYSSQTAPDNPDSDGDGFPDGREVALGANPAQPGDPTSNVTLQFSGSVQYLADGWQTFAKPSMAMLPYTYTFCFDGQTVKIPVGDASVENSVAVLTLLDSEGRGLAGGTAEYYDNGWQAIPGSTDVHGELACVIPGLRPDMTFRMTYDGTSQEKTQDIASDSYLQFQVQ